MIGARRVEQGLTALECSGGPSDLAEFQQVSDKVFRLMFTKHT